MKMNLWKKMVAACMTAMLVYFVPCTIPAFPEGLAGPVTVEAAAAIKISKEKLQVYPGEEASACLLNVPKADAGKIRWTVSNQKIASVKANGSKATVTAKKAGTVKITGTCKGKKYSCTVTVRPVTLSDKVLTLTTGKNSTLQLSCPSLRSPAGIIGWNTKKKATDTRIYWSVKNKNIVKIKASSKSKLTLIPVRKGTTYVKAVYGGKAYQCKVTVKEAAVVSISSSKKSLYKGSSVSLSLRNVPASGRSKIKWTSSNTKVAVVKASGNKVTVTAKKSGKATITGLYNGKKYKCVVTVNNKPAISTGSLSLYVTEKRTVSLKNIFSTDSEKVTWSSSDKLVAAVKGNKSKAVITAKKAGKATVTAVYNKKKYKCTVTVKELSETQPKAPDQQPQTEKTPETGSTPVVQPSTETTPSETEKNLEYEYDVIPPAERIRCIWNGDMTVYTEAPMSYITIKTASPENESCIQIGSQGEVYAYNGDRGINITLRGKKPGTETVYLYAEGELLKTYEITVWADEADLRFLAWKDEVQAKLWKAGMTDQEKLRVVGDYLIYNYVYEPTPDMYCFSQGKGGNCAASAGVIITFAWDLGLVARIHPHPEMGGLAHENVLVVIGGKNYILDATCDKTADEIHYGCLFVEHAGKFHDHDNAELYKYIGHCDLP